MILNLTDYIKNNKTTFIIALVVLLVVVVAIISTIVVFTKKARKKRDMITRMVTIAIFSALSVLLYKVLKFSLPFLPAFLEINFSNLPVIIGGLLLGPAEGIIIVIIRTIICLPMSGTAGVGEIADLIISMSIVLISALIYYKNKTRKGAVLSLIGVVLTWVILGGLANYLILVPSYIALFFNGSEEAFISTLSVIPSVNSSNYMWKYLLFGTVPFNIIISVINSIITFFVYKQMSKLFHKYDDEKE